MRCLYCGKELALLKRWTGGGEFCSDAHRQRYQEEYNQLALNRLLQAKPPAEPSAPAVKEPLPEKAVATAEPVKEVSAPAPQERKAKPAPAAAPAELAGFLVEMPVPATADAAAISRPDMEFVSAAVATLPGHDFAPSQEQPEVYELEPAGLVAFEPHQRAANCVANNSRERKLEVRDLTRTKPVLEISLSPSGEPAMGASNEPMDFDLPAQPPREIPSLWQEPLAGFPEAGIELGNWGRLCFPATGITGDGESKEPEPVAVAEAPQTEPEPILGIPSVEVHVELAALAAETPAAPEAIPVPPAPEHDPIPEMATKPLPLVLHGEAPGKAKIVPIFSAAPNAVAVQVPKSTSLPLRPAMTFGPAPAPTPAPAPEPVKEALKPAERIVPRTEPQKPALVSTETAGARKMPKPEPKAPPARLLETKFKEESRPAKPLEPPLPPPLSAPYPGSSDLGLPHLNLQPPGLLGRLPVVARIAIVVALVAGVGALIAFSSKTGGAAVNGASTGEVVAGSALPPVGESGWITDWGADPGVRRTRQISILRSSQNLTDYRVEMEGQIETKAIGWVFRAADPKNFYVAKLEIVKPGLEPSVALVHFVVLNGEEQAHTQLPLPMKVMRDTLYRIRFDAVGSRFTAYVQDQKVDEWTDDRLKTGGVGLYSERGEVATLKGSMSILPLMIRK